MCNQSNFSKNSTETVESETISHKEVEKESNALMDLNVVTRNEAINMLYLAFYLSYKS